MTCMRHINAYLALVVPLFCASCSASLSVAQQVGGSESATWVLILPDDMSTDDPMTGIFRCKEPQQGRPVCIRAKIGTSEDVIVMPDTPTTGPAASTAAPAAAPVEEAPAEEIDESGEGRGKRKRK